MMQGYASRPNRLPSLCAPTAKCWRPPNPAPAAGSPRPAPIWPAVPSGSNRRRSPTATAPSGLCSASPRPRSKNTVLSAVNAPWKWWRACWRGSRRTWRWPSPASPVPRAVHVTSRSAPSGLHGSGAAAKHASNNSGSRATAMPCAGRPWPRRWTDFGKSLRNEAVRAAVRKRVVWNNGNVNAMAWSQPMRTISATLHSARSIEGSTMDDNKRRALASALGQIEKQFGKGAVMRVVEIYGPESSGKTTLTLQVIASCQKNGGTAAFVDAEHALDPSYAGKLGVNVDDLLVSQPDTGEQALEIADMLVRSNAVDVVVVDSVAALTPKAEIEGEMGDNHMGLHARLMSQALRKLTGNIKRSNTLVIFINQIRMKIGVMFGNPKTTTGGNALKFYASVRLDIRRIGSIKRGEEVVGNMTRIKVVKNKVAPPFREAEFEIMYGAGISREGEIIELASAQGIIEKSGAWYAYKGNRIGQGKDNARAYLQSNKEVAREIEELVRTRLLPVRQPRNGNGNGNGEHHQVAANSA